MSVHLGACPPPYQKAGYAILLPAFAHQKSGQMKMADSVPPPPPPPLATREIAATDWHYFSSETWVQFFLLHNRNIPLSIGVSRDFGTPFLSSYFIIIPSSYSCIYNLTFVLCMNIFKTFVFSILILILRLISPICKYSVCYVAIVINIYLYAVCYIFFIILSGNRTLNDTYPHSMYL